MNIVVGGGYVLPLIPSHLKFLRYVHNVAEQNGLKDTLSIAILEYSKLFTMFPVMKLLC